MVTVPNGCRAHANSRARASVTRVSETAAGDGQPRLDRGRLHVYHQSRRMAMRCLGFARTMRAFRRGAFTVLLGGLLPACSASSDPTPPPIGTPAGSAGSGGTL